MKRITKKSFLILIIAIISIVFFFYFQNNSIETTEIDIRSANIPAGFHGFKIVQLSDLHSKSFGENQSGLVKEVGKANPNLIVFTGDLVDSKKYDEDASLTLMKELVQIAPVYFVTGNHEWWSGRFNSLENKLIELGVQVMRNTSAVIANGEDKIHIIGIDDPAQVNEGYSEESIAEEAIENAMDGLTDGENFKILLSHRPELFSLYSNYELDVVFSGHAHGGQVRIPFLDSGLIAPNQGFFPKYTSGKHNLNNTTMIVNRGLGNSIIPLRIFNRPEIVVATLKQGIN
ncbi:metallophosphoesterase [Sutcliffiella halmapala]|uniref:metallophosphoesterase n=1 Tax=Sutcliffiella halmapala TaxID=79882 RepID=UPI000994CA76|nr:metallophosphoesterase [Sutcliffiella halmapala]